MISSFITATYPFSLQGCSCASISRRGYHLNLAQTPRKRWLGVSFQSVRSNMRISSKNVRDTTLRRKVSINMRFPDENTRMVLITDIHGTLLKSPRDDAGRKNFDEMWERQQRQKNKSILVYTTSMNIEQYQALKEEANLLDPDHVITDNGTMMYSWEESEKDGRAKVLQLDPEWVTMASEFWDRAKVEESANLFFIKENLTVAKLEDRANPFRVSYELPKRSSIEATVSKTLPILGFLLNDMNIIAKFELSKESYILDIIPFMAGKGESAAYLFKRFKVPRDCILVAGDSGEDVPMFLRGLRFYGVAVGNAAPALVNELQLDGSNTLYYATAEYADGVLEGMKKMGFIKSCGD